jgi:methylamine---glutamate N-methyltransferase subunit A
MCGIVGLFLKDQQLEASLGRLFAPMLIEMSDRGPDSAGIAIYHDPVEPGAVKLTLFHPDAGFDWQALAGRVADEFDCEARAERVGTHAVLVAGTDEGPVRRWLERQDPELQIMSIGRVIEIYKEAGLPADVSRRFDIPQMRGSHAIGHTRMATESAVTTAGSHPFSTGVDLCLVHNGSLSNHNRLRAWLHRYKDIHFRTENDTEVAAAYLASRLLDGRSLQQALEDSLHDLDGFYTFAVGTAHGFAVLRDPIACKPAVLAETGDWVAMASEYRALAGLPGVEQARVWEPEPATVYSWSRAA